MTSNQQLPRSEPGDAAKPAARRMTQAERTALSDKRMFDAAILLINERGTHNTTLKDVGEAAGYSRGLASARFGSKEALFTELMAASYRRWTRENRAYIGDRTGLEAFKAAIESVAHFMAQNPDYLRAMFILYYETIGSSELVRRRLYEQFMDYRRDIEAWIRQGIGDGTINPRVSPERLSMHYFSLYLGVVFQWLVSPSQIEFEQALSDFKDTMFSLISLG